MDITFNQTLQQNCGSHVVFLLDESNIFMKNYLVLFY